jgi:hypothetical protein
MDQQEQLPVDQIAPLTMLAKELDVTYDSIRRWADADRNNDFPKAVESIGPVRFYERAAVERWYALYQMTNLNNRGRKPNGARRGT